MLRSDLLALSSVDLADISNRGTVNRATKEIEGGKVTWEMTVSDGTLIVAWSDGPTSKLPAGRVLSDAECDCAATGMCRHIIRSVLAYQLEFRGTEDVGTLPPAGPWNPGQLTDEQLGEVFPARLLEALARTRDAGLVVELVKSEKPTARFHKLGHTIRFQVPYDIRYTQCDCAERAPCRHAVLAVWAFRRMSSDDAEIVTTGPGDERVAPELLRRAESAVVRVVGHGIMNLPRPTMDRIRSTATDLKDNGLVWPAEILADLQRQYEHYHAHDARFSPDTVADLVGELIVRVDALSKPDLDVPQLFVRGHASDSETRLGQTRLVGLGCAVQLRQRSVVIQAMLQDDSTGSVVAVRQSFTDPDEEGAAPEDLSSLAAKLVVKGRDLVTIGGGQLVIKTARLSSAHQLSLGRSTASVYSQNYAWESLRAPVAAESLAEVRARLSALPPASLRPRRVGEDLHVVSIASVEGAHFSAREQAVRATLYDSAGNAALLIHPYTSRNRHGTERLLNWLTRTPETLLFVAGTFQLGASGVVVSPTGVVFGDRDHRTLVQPWVDDMDHHMETADVPLEPPRAAAAPLDVFRAKLAALVGDSILIGSDQAMALGTRDWEKLATFGHGLQLFSVQRALTRAQAAIDGRDKEKFVRTLLEVAVLTRLAHEVG